MSKNMRYMASWTWLISLSMMIHCAENGCSIHFLANDIISFLWLCVYMYIYTHIYIIFYIYDMCNIFFIHLLVVGHLNWLHSLAIVNRTAINMGMHVSFLYAYLHFFEYSQQNLFLSLLYSRNEPIVLSCSFWGSFALTQTSYPYFKTVIPPKVYFQSIAV
jgi:hypothetical protein